MKLHHTSQGLLAAVALASACSLDQQVSAGPSVSTDGATTTTDGTDTPVTEAGGVPVDAAVRSLPILARPVKVGVHRRVQGIDVQAASDKLQRMNGVLEANGPVTIEECTDFAADLAVGVQFELDSVEDFDVGDGDIETLEEYLEVAALPYDFKIVRSISWCGCTQTEHPEILGCAEQKEAVVVALPDYGVEPVVWAHEYGHFAGLRHSDQADSVMFPYAGRCKVLVDELQRQLYREPTNDAAPLQTCNYSGLALLRPAESEAELEDQIREFVTATHVHGLSYEQARAFGARPHALEYLLTLLEDPAFLVHRGQIALAIGAIGGEQAIERLTAFVEDSELEAGALPALRVVLPAIGWALSAPEAEPLVDKTLAFLAERADVGFWKEGVASISADERDAIAKGLGARAAMGLAFSGNNARDSLEQAFAQAENEDVMEVIQHMQRVNQEIQASSGGDLAAYYAGRR